MLSDLSRMPTGAEIACDICVVGSGAAGMAIANEFLGSTRSVFVLESGGIQPEPATQALYDCESTGVPFAGAETGRSRTVGGTTTVWGGQSLPLSPIDFEPRDWVPYSGWPVSFETLVPYYRRANAFFRADATNSDTDLIWLLKASPPSFAWGGLRYHFSRWCPEPNLRKLYIRGIERSRNVELVQHANVVDIDFDTNLTRVEAIGAQSLDGRRLTVRPQYVVLCCGGIETARLLLACNRQHPHGIGNKDDLVGRFFQDHPAARIGILKANDADHVQRVFNVFHRQGQKYSVRVSASEELQRRSEILNATGAIMFVPSDESAYEALKDVYRRTRRGNIDLDFFNNVIHCMRTAPTLAVPIWHYYVKSRTYTPDATFEISVNSEQEPSPDSRISLTEERDGLGMRRVRVHWSLSDLVAETYRVFARTLRQEFARADLGDIKLADWLECGADDWREYISDQNHHIGTTRMHSDPQRGVVDTNCRVYGTQNLFIGGSAVFPTGGHSNPTLTLVALALRIADHLKAPGAGTI